MFGLLSNRCDTPRQEEANETVLFLVIVSLKDYGVLHLPYFTSVYMFSGTIILTESAQDKADDKRNFCFVPFYYYYYRFVGRLWTPCKVLSCTTTMWAKILNNSTVILIYLKVVRTENSYGKQTTIKQVTCKTTFLELHEARMKWAEGTVKL